jgi:hypothetical protein
VGADGKPVSSPPLITKIVNEEGETVYLASYPAGQGSALEYYKPPSSKSKGGTPV